jgi:hypothetical protein
MPPKEQAIHIYGVCQSAMVNSAARPLQTFAGMVQLYCTEQATNSYGRYMVSGVFQISSMTLYYSSLTSFGETVNEG